MKRVKIEPRPWRSKWICMIVEGSLRTRVTGPSGKLSVFKTKQAAFEGGQRVVANIRLFRLGQCLAKAGQAALVIAAVPAPVRAALCTKVLSPKTQRLMCGMPGGSLATLDPDVLVALDCCETVGLPPQVAIPYLDAMWEVLKLPGR